MGRHTREQRDAYSRLRNEVRKSATTSAESIISNHASQSAVAMPISQAVIDLTGDDDAPSERRRAQVPHGSQSITQNGGKPAAGSSNSARGRPPLSSSTQRASSTAVDITSAPSRNADQRRSVNDQSQSGARVNTPRSRNSESRSTPTNGSAVPASRNSRSSKRVPEVDLTEEDEEDVSDRPPPKQFKMPRGYTPTGATPPSSQTGLTFSPRKTNGELSRKRPLESQSPRESPSNRSSPFKRQKLAKSGSDDRNESNSQSESRSSTKFREEPSTRSGRSSLPGKATPNRSQNASRNSPAQTRPEQTLPDTRNTTTPTKTAKPITSPANLSGSRPSPLTRKDDKKLSSGPEMPAPATLSTQSKQGREASQKTPETPSSLSSIPFRSQRSPSTVDATSTTDGKASGPAMGRGESKGSQGLNEQREASLATNSSTEELNGGDKASKRRERSNEGRRDGTALPRKGEPRGSTNQNARTNLKGVDESNTSASGASLRRTAPYAMSADSSTKASWKTSLREDEEASPALPNAQKNSQKKLRTESTTAASRNSVGSSHSSPDPTGSPPSSKADSGNKRSAHDSGAVHSKDPVRPSKSSKSTRDAESATQAGSIINPLASEILGDLQFAPTARDVLKRDPNLGRVELTHLRDILEKYPAAKTDGAALSLYVTSDDMPSNGSIDETEEDQRESFNTNLDELDLAEEPSRMSFTEAEAADLQLQSEAMQDIVQQDDAKKAPKAFVPPTVSASALRASPIFSTLPLASRVEKVLGRYLEELRGDAEYWTSVSMRRARHSKEDGAIEGLTESTATPSEELTSFAHIKPLNFPMQKKASSSAKCDEGVWHVQRMSTESKPQAHVDRSAQFVTFASEIADVPTYAHYVSIKNNILAPNVMHLHYWPYFGDDFDITTAVNLGDYFNVDILDRERKLLLLLQAQKYEEYAQSTLQDLECSWADVLRFLLEASPDVGSDLDARKAYQNRPQYCEHDFSRASGRWITVLSSLPESTPEKLGRVAVLCETFQKMAKFSIWHVAKRCDLAKLPGTSKTIPAQPSDNELTCRICLRFNCPYHGQFKHHAEDSGSDYDNDNDSVSSVDTVVANDIVHPPKGNYRSRIAFPADSPMKPPSDPDAPVKKRQKDPNYWNNYKNKAEDRGPFYPCNHPGTSCEDARCRCFERNIPCEKSCGCSPACPRKFKGCSCGLRKGHRLVCFEDADCACYQLGRECDPDLCGACGVCDVVDPVNKYNDGILAGRCRNACIQRGVPKHTLLGDSGVHGLGLYACEPIKQNDFVGEYKGEIITKREADRRGAVYEHQKLSYLFSLNKAQEIDSTYFGNKVRFINHAHGDKANLYPRIIMVNTVHRIALYAAKDIGAGKELLFDYGPYFPDDQLQGKKSKKSTQTESKKSAPHVRNANLVREFYDVEESEDEDGHLRTKAVAHRAAGTKGRANGRRPRGGARPSAGRKPHPAKAPVRETLQNVASDGGKAQTVEERLTAFDKAQNAQERLTAFNISDDPSSGYMDVDPNGTEEEDEAFEPEGSETDDSEDSEEIERSEDFDDEEDDELEQVRSSRRRAVANMRNRR